MVGLELLTLIINFNYKGCRKFVASEINCRLIYRNEFSALRSINIKEKRNIIDLLILLL